MSLQVLQVEGHAQQIKFESPKVPGGHLTTQVFPLKYFQVIEAVAVKQDTHDVLLVAEQVLHGKVQAKLGINPLKI